MLRRLGASFHPIPAGRIGDLLAELDGRKYLVEARAWTSRRLPAAGIRGLSERLSRTADQIGAHETLIVTKSSIVGPAATAVVPRVKLLSLRQLGPYLISQKGASNAA